MTAIADIPVRLDDDATSGLASIVQQFLEQQLADSTEAASTRVAFAWPPRTDRD